VVKSPSQQLLVVAVAVAVAVAAAAAASVAFAVLWQSLVPTIA